MSDRGSISYSIEAAARVLSGNRHSPALLLFALAMASAAAAVATVLTFSDTQQAFAQQPEPQVFSRSVSDSVSVASTFDGPRAPRMFYATISDGLTVTTTPSPPPPPAAAAASPAGSNSSNARQGPSAPATIGRVEERTMRGLYERSDNRLLLYGSGSQNAVSQTGTPAVAEFVAAQPERVDHSELATAGGDGDDPDGSNSSSNNLLEARIRLVGEQLRASQSMNNAFMVGAASSATYTALFIGLVVSRSAPAKNGKVLMVERLRGPDQSPASRLILLAGLGGMAALSAIGAGGSQQAFADNQAGMAYKSGTTTLAYREWDPATTTWGAATTVATTSQEIYAVKYVYDGSSNRRAIGLIELDGDIRIYYCDFSCTTAANWTAVFIGDANSAGNITAPYKYFDITFESASGDLMVVYDRDATEANDFYYKTIDFTTNPFTVSSEQGFSYIGASADAEDIRFFRMASKSNSDEIAMILLDATNTDAYAFIWNGSAWGSQQTISSNPLVTGENIGIAYESSSGAALAVAGDNSGVQATTGRFFRYTGSWSGVTTFDINPGATSNSLWFVVKANPLSTSNQVMACNTDNAATPDLSCHLITAGSSTSNTTRDTAVASSVQSARMFDVAWDPAGSTGVIVYEDRAAATSIKFRTFNASGTLSYGAERAITVAVQTRWLVGASDTDAVTTGVDSLWLWYEDQATDDIGDGEWNRTSTTATMTDNGDSGISADSGAVNTVEVMALDFRKNDKIKRYASDSLAVTESIRISVTKPLGDTLALAGSISLGFFRSISNESLTVSDTGITRAVIPNRSMPETLGAADSVSAKITRRALSDQATVTDSASRSVTVIPDSNLAAIVYASSSGNGINYPKYREWDPSTKSWGSEVELASAGSPVRNAWLEFSPVSSKRVAVVLSDDGTLDSYVCDNNCTTLSQWTVTNDFADMWSVAPAAQKRPFDMEFATTSGDLYIVYDRNEGDNNQNTDLFYRVMRDSSNTFGSENPIDDTGSTLPDTTYSFVRLDARRTSGSNDLGLIATDSTNSRAVAWYFDGSTETFGNFVQLASSGSLTNSGDYEVIGIAFVTSTGSLMAVWGEGNNIKYSRFTGGSWSAAANVSDPGSGRGTTVPNVGTVRWIKLVAAKATGADDLIMAFNGYDAFVHRLDVFLWQNDSAWKAYVNPNADANMPDSATRNFDVTWNNADDATRGILVWGANGVIKYIRYTEGNAWTAAFSITDDGTSHPWVSLNEGPNPTTTDSTHVLGAAIDVDADTTSVGWTKQANPVFSHGNDGITTTGTTASESFHLDWRRSGLFKRFPSDSVAVADSLLARIRTANIADTITFAESMLAEKGTESASSSAAAIYKSNTGTALLNSPKYREWILSTQSWSSEVELPNTGSPMRDGRIRFSPDSSLRAAVTVHDDGTLNLFKCDNSCTSASSWTFVAADFADTGTPAFGEPYRQYDTMFESAGEKLLIVYDKEGTGNDDFFYRTYDGTTLSAESSFDLGGAGDAELRYFKLAPHPSTGEMVLTVMDATNSKAYALVWNGSGWSNQITLSSSLNAANRDGESIGAAYDAAGSALAVSASGTDSLAYARWSGSSWGSVSSVDPNSGASASTKFLSVRGDPAPLSTNVMVCQSDDQSDLTCSQFAAGSPGPWTAVTTNTGTVSARAFDYVYHPSGTAGTLVYATSAPGITYYRPFTGSAFGSDFAISTTGTAQWVQGVQSLSGQDYVNALFLKSNSGFDAGALKYKANVVSLIGEASLTGDEQSESQEGFHLDFQKSKRVKRSAADTVTVTPALNIVKINLLSDILGMADAITKIAHKHVSDALAVAEAAAAGKRYSRAISDSMAFADDIDFSVSRSLEETLAVTEVSGRRLLASRSASDSVTAADSPARAYISSRDVADPLGVADSASRSVAFARATSDSILMSDAVARTLAAARSASDSVTLADDVAATQLVARGLPNAAAVSDAIAARLSASRTAADSVAPTDSVGRSTVFARSVSDAVAAADAVSTALAAARSTSDSITAIDSIAPTYFASRPASDTVALADTITVQYLPSRSVADSLAITDTLAERRLLALREASDAAAVTDSVSTALAASRSASDSLAATDSIARMADVSKSLFDGFGTADAVAARLAASRSLSDSVAAADAVSTAVTRSLSDSVAATDAITTRISRSITDLLAVTDSISSAATRQVADAISVTDSTEGRYLASRSASDALAAADGVARQHAAARSASDAMSATDAAERTLSASRGPADALAASDLVAATSAFDRQLSDSVAATDTVSPRLQASRSASDALAATDAAAPAVAFARQVADSVATTDGVSRTIAFARSASDSIAAADGIARTVAASRPASDSLAVTDAASRLLSASRSALDSVSATDSAATAAAYDRSAQDSLAATDQVRSAAARPASDSLSIGDSVAMSVSRSITDTLAVTDVPSYAASRSPSDSLQVTDAISARTSRSATDTLAVSDSTAVRVSRSLSDALAVTDDTRKAAATSAADSLAVADTLAARVSSRSAADSVAVTDLVSKSVVKGISDTVSATEAINRPSIPVSETLAATDSVSIAAGRRAVDAVSLADSVTVSTSRRTADTLALLDSVSIRTSRSIADALAVQDGGVSTAKTAKAADSLAATDGIRTSVTRSVADSLAAGDAVRTAINRSVSDALAVNDGVSGSKRTDVADSASVRDAIAKAAGKKVADATGVSDVISTAVTRSVSDSLEVRDALPPRHLRTASDQLATADALSMSVTRSLADALAVADAVTVQPRVADSVAMTDTVRIAVTRSIADSLAIADSIPRAPGTSETLAVSDSVGIGVAKSLAESLKVEDSVGPPPPPPKPPVNIPDLLSLSDSVVTRIGRLVPVPDSVTVADQITNVSVHWNRNFGEGLGLQECTPFACSLVASFGETLSIGHGQFTSPPFPTVVESLPVTDAIVINRPQTFISLNDSAPVSVGLRPVLPILVNNKPEDHGDPPATELPGVQNWNGDPVTARDTLGLEPLYFNSTIVRSNLPNQVVTLRPHHMTAAPTPQLPGDDVIVSDWAANLDGNVPVQMVVDFEDTPALWDHRDFIGRLAINWTPAQFTTNFVLVVTVIDAPPAGATLPPEELRPLYVNIRWDGNFPGGNDPAVRAYYANPPRFTFTVNDEWARTQGALRDENGVPQIRLRLLNEATNQWEEVTAIQTPASGTNGEYTYVATLEHFSTYAITAVKAAASSPGGSQGGGVSPTTPAPLPAVPGAALTAQLAESLLMGDASESVPIEEIEEFGQKKFRVGIADSVAILTRPVSFKTFNVGNVEVRITVQEVKQESIVPPRAVATFLVEMLNHGGKDEEFRLNFWYYDQEGTRPWESSQVARLGPYESKQLLVDVPFWQPGTFEVTAEARSVPGDDLVATTELTVMIPWLSINLYIVILVAIAILGGSGAFLALALRAGMAGGAGAGLWLLFAGRKKTPSVRVTEDAHAIEDEYDIIVEAKQRGPGAVDLEISNRSSSRQDFVLRYWAVDPHWRRRDDHSERIKIGGRKSIHMTAKLTPGNRFFVVEAGPADDDGGDEEKRWSHTWLRLRADDGW